MQVETEQDRRNYDAEPRNWARQVAWLVFVAALAAMIWLSCGAVVWVLG